MLSVGADMFLFARGVQEDTTAVPTEALLDHPKRVTGDGKVCR
jgi:hypothetical protein